MSLTKKLFFCLGILGWSAFTAAGVIAWLAAAAHMDITVSSRDDRSRVATAAAETAEEVAALRRDYAFLAADISALAAGLDKNFAMLSESVAATSRAGAGAAAVPAQAAPAQVASAEPRAPVTATAEIAPAPAPSAEAPRRFLSFALPTRTFAFDAANRFELIPSLSRVGFDAKSTLHDFTGVTSDLEGDFEMNLAHPETLARGSIAAMAAGIDTGVEGRNAEMLEHLDQPRHPAITFALKGIEKAVVDADAQDVRGTATGEMTIRGVTRPFSMPVHLAFDKDKRLIVEGQAPLRLTDYQVPVPNQLGLIQMEDQVAVWISLRARSVGRAAEGQARP